MKKKELFQKRLALIMMKKKYIIFYANNLIRLKILIKKNLIIYAIFFNKIKLF